MASNLRKQDFPASASQALQFIHSQVLLLKQNQAFEASEDSPINPPVPQVLAKWCSLPGPTFLPDRIHRRVYIQVRGLSTKSSFCENIDPQQWRER